MSLQPLLSASWPIQLHVYTLVLAFVVGTGQLFVTRKGSRTHRILGRCFLALMLVSALVTLLIHVRNPQGRFFRAEPAASLCPAGGRFVCDCVVRGGQAPDPASQVRGICVVLRVAGVHRLRADLPGRRDYARDLFRHPRGLQGPAPRCPVMRLIRS